MGVVGGGQLGPVGLSLDLLVLQHTNLVTTNLSYKTTPLSYSTMALSPYQVLFILPFLTSNNLIILYVESSNFYILDVCPTATTKQS